MCSFPFLRLFMSLSTNRVLTMKAICLKSSCSVLRCILRLQNGIACKTSPLICLKNIFRMQLFLGWRKSGREHLNRSISSHLRGTLEVVMAEGFRVERHSPPHHLPLRLVQVLYPLFLPQEEGALPAVVEVPVAVEEAVEAAQASPPLSLHSTDVIVYFYEAVHGWASI